MTDVNYFRFLSVKGNYEPLGIAETRIALWDAAVCSAPSHRTVEEWNPLECYQYATANAAIPQIVFAQLSEVGRSWQASLMR